MLSALAITEVSAVAHKRREGALSAAQASEIRDVALTDAESGLLRRPDLRPLVHRYAEGLLLNGV